MLIKLHVDGKPYFVDALHITGIHAGQDGKTLVSGHTYLKFDDTPEHVAKLVNAVRLIYAQQEPVARLRVVREVISREPSMMESIPYALMFGAAFSAGGGSDS